MWATKAQGTREGTDAWEGSGSEHFRLCRPYVLRHNHPPFLFSRDAALDAGKQMSAAVFPQHCSPSTQNLFV